jgi:hypothetical protein
MKLLAKALFVIPLVAFFVSLPLAWCVNIYKLVQCDFEESYRGEIVHTIGVCIPPASLITVWNNDK